MISHKNCTSLALWVVLFSPLVCLAGMTSGKCVDCHTMHDSQDNSALARAGIFGALSGPQDMLLKLDCIACHTGTNTGATDVSPYESPFVDDSSGAVIYMNTGTEIGANTLAGGTFYWVRTDSDAMGHNVNQLTGADTGRFTKVPGDPATDYFFLECAGTNGCHGDRSAGNDVPIVAMKGSHHNNDHTIWKDGTTLPKSYRFLNGIQGYGSSKYEYPGATTLTRNEHNRYFGKVRNDQSDPAAPDFQANSVNGTISGFCALCHQDFHNGNNSLGIFGSGVWIRHPTDYDMSDSVSSKEYLDYNFKVMGTTGGQRYYNVVAPLSTAVKNTTPQEFVFTGSNNDAIVMCISCHRAHGSEFHSALRWNYRDWPSSASKSYDGCSICHATKD